MRLTPLDSPVLRPTPSPIKPSLPASPANPTPSTAADTPSDASAEPVESISRSLKDAQSQSDFSPVGLPKGLNFTKNSESEPRSSISGVNRLRGLSTNDGDQFEELGTTPSGARVTIDRDGGAGGFLCSHVTRLNSEFRIQNPNLISGFIHIPDTPQTDQLSDVLGMGVKGIVDSRGDARETTILMTGFTQFGSVTDNSTSAFLFGDGTSTEPSSFGYRPDALRPGATGRTNIDNMMEAQFGPPASVRPFERQGLPVGLSYTYNDPPRTVNLALVRLPVDEVVTDRTRGENNLRGDGTGNSLTIAYNAVKPDAIISTGVGVYGSDEQNRYEIEVQGSGYQPAAQRYRHPETANESLADVYRTAMRP